MAPRSQDALLAHNGAVKSAPLWARRALMGSPLKKCLDTMNGAAVVRTMAHTVADWLLHQYKVQVQAIFQKSWPLCSYKIIYLINNWPHSSTMWVVSQHKNSSILTIVFHWVHLVYVRSVPPSPSQFSLASTLVTTTGPNVTITLYTWRIQKKAVRHNEIHQQVLISLAWLLLFVLLYMFSLGDSHLSFLCDRFK